MSSLCCQGGRSESPALPNARTLEPFREKDTIDQKKDEQAIKAIFRQRSSTGECLNSDVDVSRPDDIQRRPSTLRLHDVTTKIRKRLSRDSGMSKKSYRKVRSATSEEEVERRRELKRALHRRLQEELLTDRTAEQGGYDSDAESLVTPTFDDTLAEGENHDKPAGIDKYGHNGGLSESSCTSDEVLLPRGGSPIKAAAILGIRIQACSPQWAPKASSDRQVEKPLALRNTNPPDISTRRSSKQTTSDFVRVSRSNTVKHIGPVGLPNKRYSSLPHRKTRKFTPDLVSSSTRRVQSAQLLNDTKQKRKSRDIFSFVEDHAYSQERISLSSAQGFTNKNADAEGRASEGRPDDSELQSENTPLTQHDPASPKVAERPLEQSNYHVRSEPSVHLYDMRISQRLASRSLIPSNSLPHLSDSKHNHRHTRGKSSVGSFSAYSTKAERRRQNSSTGFASAKVPGSWGNVVKDGASSIYPSQDNSLPSTSSSSLNHLGYKFNNTQAKGYESIAAELARDFLRHDEPQVSTKSSALRRRTIGSTDDINKSSPLETPSVPRTSKFKEEPGRSARDLFPYGYRSTQQLKGDQYDSRQPDALNSIGTQGPFDGSAEKRPLNKDLDHSDLQVLQPSIRRQKSTVSTIPNVNDEDAAAIWERALRNHASHEAVWSRTRTSIYSNGNSITDRSINERTVSQESVFKGRAEDSPTYFSQVHYGSSSLKTKPTPRAVSWSRYPSHTRHERTSSAGESDKVIPRDFASEFESHGDAANARLSKRPLMERKKKKSRSMTFGKNIFKSWGRLYKSQSADFRRYGAGHRSSITIGGILEYPELEILPPVLAPSTSWHNQVGSLSVSPQQEKIVKSDLAHSERANSEPPTESPSGARVWSQLYESCVDLPSDTEPNTSADIEGSGQQAMLLSSGWVPSHLRRSSANSGADLRRPTRDFEELLRAGEMQERDRLLKAAEKAWGD
ncbi:MAG: hypothetical protein M1812_005650 [Candelaria pacifica]|nr:MAG: hypothetical protein M1812_005650 [Candelaria pacifica]